MTIKEHVFSRKLRWTDFVLVAAFTILAIACTRLQVSFSDIFSRTTEVSFGYIGRTSKGIRYVIDNGHARLLAFDKDAQERFEIVDPSDDGEAVLYIDDVFVDDDGIYLSASEWDGMLLTRELILAYDNEGVFQQTVFELTYDLEGSPTNKHRFYGLHREGDSLVWAECRDDMIWVHTSDLDGQNHMVAWTPPYDNAFNAISDIVFDEGDLIILNKNGSINRHVRHASPQLLYKTTWTGEQERVPFRLALSEGSVYFTDFRSGTVQRVITKEKRSETVREGTDSQTVTFSEDGKEMLLAESEGLRVVGEDGSEVCYDSLHLATSLATQRLLFLVCLVLLVLAVGLILVRLVCILRDRSLKQANTVPLVVVTVALVVCTIVSYLLIGSFRTLYLAKIREQLQMTATQVSLRITKEDLDGVSQAQDFDSDSYENLITVMEQSMPLDVDFFHTTYCNILRLSEDGKSGYAIAYRDQSIGTFFPLDELETAEVVDVYQTASPVWNDQSQDVSGTYVSVKTPIMGEADDVVGVASVGADTSVVTELISEMQREVLLSIVLILLLFWIIATEAVALASQSTAHKALRAGDQVLPAYLTRFFVFSVFAAFNLVSSFLPIYVLHYSSVVDETWHELAATLPLSINILAMGVMSLFCASAMHRFGTRRVFAGSMACSLVGNIALFAAPSYPFIVLGLLLDGIGVGMITNAIYVALAYLPNENERESAFSTYNGASMSGINFGTILGSILAVSIGQRLVFMVVVATWASLMLLAIHMAGRMDHLLNYRDEQAETIRGSIKPTRFLASRPIWSFILLVQNPYIVFNGFVFYFVPLFCEGAGLRETITSVLLMVYSQTAVTLGDSLTEHMEKTFGGRSVYVALALNVAAIALFIATQSFWGLVGALLLLGVGASFAKPCQQALYLRQDASKRLGEDQAMGIYNFSENIGESLGPIVFGSLMAGPLGYVWAFLGAVTCAGTTHFALNRKEMRHGD